VRLRARSYCGDKPSRAWRDSWRSDAQQHRNALKRFTSGTELLIVRLDCGHIEIKLTNTAA
jgi:hypothetical protein